MSVSSKLFFFIDFVLNFLFFSFLREAILSSLSQAMSASRHYNVLFQSSGLRDEEKNKAAAGEDLGARAQSPEKISSRV